MNWDIFWAVYATVAVLHYIGCITSAADDPEAPSMLAVVGVGLLAAFVWPAVYAAIAASELYAYFSREEAK
jgi:hypothetical protein